MLSLKTHQCEKNYPNGTMDAVFYQFFRNAVHNRFSFPFALLVFLRSRAPHSKPVICTCRKELCGSGKASSKDTAGANVGVGQEDGDEDEQTEQGVVHKGRLSHCSEEGVDAMGESPGGGGEGPVGEVVGDDRTMAKEGGPGVGLVDGLVRHYFICCWCEERESGELTDAIDHQPW